MARFSSGAADLVSGPFELLIRLVMCALPILAFSSEGITMSVATAAFLAAFDGYLRLWSCFTSRALVADSDGLEISSTFGRRVVPWADFLAIETWHHFNRIDYVAVHYDRGGRVEIATCASRYAEEELRAFVRACAARVSSPEPRRSIVVAGLRDAGVYRPLLKRWAADVVAATAVGALLGAPGPSLGLGLLAASLSAAVAALRHPIRALELVQRDGFGRFSQRDGKPPTIPRSLTLWVHSLSQVSSRSTLGADGAAAPL